jgi:asparagine synthase (glutamine-hydrolysing)
MTRTLVHRGPDGEGYEYPAPNVGFGHRRLSIIDLEGGRQPLSNEDGTVWITFNGEIFNYRELREELEGKGHTFRTASDTEVIVHLFEEEGIDCAKRLNGQFAFAIWDGARLWCARDPVGIKPLYTYLDEGRFAFASEPRAFSRLPDFDSQLDLDGIRLFLRYRFIPPPHSALRHVGKLLPGEWLVVEPDGEIRRQRYWALDPARLETVHDLDDATERAREVLKEAVHSQLVADVPVGAFLSGGLDSSSVVGLMSEHLPEAFRTYSIGFPDSASDERDYAQLVADRFKTTHSVQEIGPEVAEELINAFLSHVDEPLGDPAVITNLYVARLARKDLKVVLSGDGGDELFAGYSRYYKALSVLSVAPWARPAHGRFKFVRKLKGSSRDPADWCHPDGGDVRVRYHRELERTSARERAKLYGPALRDLPPPDDPVERVFDRAATFPPLSQILAVDLHSILSEYYLAKVDRTSMMTSLEARVPMLDVNFIEFAFSLAPEVRLHLGESKGVLREAMRSLLPSEIVDRQQKRGFGPPLKHWFAAGLGRVARERLESSRLVEEGLIDRTELRRIVATTEGKKAKGGTLWQLLVLESFLCNLRGGFRGAE